MPILKVCRLLPPSPFAVWRASTHRYRVHAYLGLYHWMGVLSGISFLKSRYIMLVFICHCEKHSFTFSLVMMKGLYRSILHSGFKSLACCTGLSLERVWHIVSTDINHSVSSNCLSCCMPREYNDQQRWHLKPNHVKHIYPA